jgi:hypothetical protein
MHSDYTIDYDSTDYDFGIAGFREYLATDGVTIMQERLRRELGLSSNIDKAVKDAMNIIIDHWISSKHNPVSEKPWHDHDESSVSESASAMTKLEQVILKDDHSHDHQTEVGVLSIGHDESSKDAAVNADKLMAFFRTTPGDGVFEWEHLLCSLDDATN